MPEPELNTGERATTKELKAKIAELERTVKALLVFVKDYESDNDEFMPAGDYYGIKFE